MEAKYQEINVLNEKAWDVYDTDTVLARNFAEEALQKSLEVNFRSGQALSSLVLSKCFWFSEDYDRGIEYGKKAKTMEFDIAEYYHPFIHLNLGNIYQRLDQIATAQEAFKKAEKLSIEYNNINALATAQNNLGVLFWKLGEYATALEYYQQCLKNHQQLDKPKKLSMLHTHIGFLYEKQQNFAEALKHYEKSILLKKEVGDQKGIAHVHTNIGVTHSKQQEFLKSHEHYSEALKIYEELSFKEGVAFTHSNIADTYIHSGEPHKAVLHLLKAIQIFRELNNSTHLAIALTNLATAYSKAGELLKAEVLLPEIEELLKGIEAKAVSVEIHRDLSHVYEALGDVHRSLTHCREFHRLDKEIFNEESDRRLKNIQIIHQVEQMQKDKEKAEIEAEKLKAENDFKTKELTTLALHLVQKNSLIENISHEVQRTLSTLDDAKRILLKNVLRAIRDANLKDTEWQQFEEQFQKVHGEFLVRLAEKHHDLSPAELKVCALLKLGLANKQISTLLNISLRTVEFHRLNIRKKLALPDKSNLISYLQKF